MRDTNKDGIINETKLFGDYPGTGVFINDDDLYTSSNSGVYRYKMNAKGEVIDYQKPEVIVSGLVDRKRDNAKPLVVDKQNIIYVTIGSYNNPSREMGSGKGINPCSILDSAGFFVNFGEKYLIKQF